MCILLGIILTHFARKYREMNQNETLESISPAYEDDVIYQLALYGNLEERKVG